MVSCETQAVLKSIMILPDNDRDPSWMSIVVLRPRRQVGLLGTDLSWSVPLLIYTSSHLAGQFENKHKEKHTHTHSLQNRHWQKKKKQSKTTKRKGGGEEEEDGGREFKHAIGWTRDAWSQSAIELINRHALVTGGPQTSQWSNDLQRPPAIYTVTPYVPHTRRCQDILLCVLVSLGIFIYLTYIIPYI